jgi:hypothetical protein
LQKATDDTAGQNNIMIINLRMSKYLQGCKKKQAGMGGLAGKKMRTRIASGAPTG